MSVSNENVSKFFWNKTQICQQQQKSNNEKKRIHTDVTNDKKLKSKNLKFIKYWRNSFSIV